MDKAHELGFVVAADTNPEVFKLIGATPNNLKPFDRFRIRYYSFGW